jgi:hypothetical protein
VKLRFACATVLLLAGCPARGGPTAPPPEYEPPIVTPWDAGAPADPLEGVEGEEVTDDEPPAPADAAPDVPTDGPEGDAGT